ncbi:TOBE domain-containing protein [Rhizobium sp. S95]|uniref:TOBE domain-containing protein n=2 Tax=Rhizobiaceae TaxID=82115 RepID=A0AAJ1BYK5_9HYPH|nr:MULTISPECIES: TOBE domain-containing protein [unclassified Ciceribacter]MCM2394645.1 TOBE domain-containing protein [Ciceribacter sp. S95]MCO5958648.1 TOBE domain-containing protein [Ciceribacter sp. S101]
MGEANFLDARIDGISGGEVRVETALGQAVLPATAFTAGQPSEGGKATLCIRPEHFRTGGEGGAAISLGSARIVDSAFFGAHLRCHLQPERPSGVAITAHLPQTAKPQAGDLLELAVPADTIVALV